MKTAASFLSSAIESSLRQWMQQYQHRVNRALEGWLTESRYPGNLGHAMRYAALGEGKRIRPLLVYATGTALGIEVRDLDGPACAVELIHAYSLVHDDLPAMDNDDLRRGRPTCHKAFGESMAILAGDGLQALAFEVLARHPSMGAGPAQRLNMIGTLAEAAGARGMVGGQASDMASAGSQLSLDALDTIHLHKTGALIRASVRLGALSRPGTDDALLEALDDYATCVGLAFQIRDDILDSTGNGAGPVGAAPDTRHGQPTYMAILSIEAAEQRALALHRRALASLARLDEQADVLRWLSAFAIARPH